MSRKKSLQDKVSLPHSGVKLRGVHPVTLKEHTDRHPISPELCTRSLSGFRSSYKIFYRILRYVFLVVITTIIIAVTMPISKPFTTSLENFLGIISYWGALLIGVISVENLCFHKASPANYNPAIWNDGSKLLLGAAAIGAVAVPLALIVPCMSQAWYTGPIAKTTGVLVSKSGYH